MTGRSSKPRVLVAMSGGVDSSVAAALVKASGAEPVGVWMRLSDVADSYSEFKRSCCSLDAAEDARRVASQLDIPFYILNLEREFDEGVLQPFMRSYLEGRTPSPCVECNTVVKFGALLGQARLMYDCDAVATGHYARIEEPGGDTPAGYRLLRGLDPNKDQSYFLYGLGQEQLAHAQFPVGEMTKPQVREAARALGLATAEKRDSQEICFVPRGNYREVLRERAGWKAEPGRLLDVDGSQVGEHFGAAAYTVGQRQGTGVALGEPRYVWKIDPGANVIKLGRRKDLEVRRFEVEEVKFVAGDQPEYGPRGGAEDGGSGADAPRADGFRAEVQIRHRGRPGAATVRPLESGRWAVETDDPVWAAAPGQAAVFYRGEVVLGGGKIAQAVDPTGDPGE
ncbi:MAG: tRNA 2-thiouridine(34) synthase MnmA [Candidatus Limnocylindrales bacterium]